MAEFKDVIKQQKRMCMTIGKCGKCPLHSMDYDCRFMAMIDADYDAVDVEAIERIVIDWAEKHPELMEAEKICPATKRACCECKPGGPCAEVVKE